MTFSLERYVINDICEKEIIIKYGMSMPEFEEIDLLLQQNERYVLISKSYEIVTLSDLPTEYLDTLLVKTSKEPKNSMVLTEIHRIINAREDSIK
ncbi:hypothetical protein D3C73_278430 [compost metagenome]